MIRRGAGVWHTDVFDILGGPNNAHGNKEEPGSKGLLMAATRPKRVLTMGFFDLRSIDAIGAMVDKTMEPRTTNWTANARHTSSISSCSNSLPPHQHVVLVTAHRHVAMACNKMAS